LCYNFPFICGHFLEEQSYMKHIKLVFLLGFTLFFAYAYVFHHKLSAAQGQGSLAAPTGVIASDGAYSNKVGLLWDAIRGATAYRIFRNTTNNTATATDLGATPANYFFDATAVTSQNYFYWVRAENGGVVSAFSQPDQGVRAVGVIEPGSPFPPLQPPSAPAGNPITAAKTFLGKTLFWDEQLSSTKTASCGTCHHPGSGGSDPRSKNQIARSTNPGPDGQSGTADDVLGSPGVVLSNANGSYVPAGAFGLGEQVTGRKANSFVNAGYPNALFWDGRATEVMRDPITNQVVLPAGAALESQILGPPVSAVEMGHIGRNWGEVAAQINVSTPLALSPSIPAGLRNWIDNRNYPQLFEEAFGTPEVTPVRIALAIATYERTLFSDQTPLDRAAMQIEPLTAQEQAGFQVFTSNVCNFCHGGALLGDDTFNNIGVRPINEDAGRFIQTGSGDDLASFRTPGLRNVELRGPFMHNGRFSALEDVIEFYNRGGDFDAPNINRNVIRPMELSAADKASLLAFMKRPLTDPRVAAELPPFDRPALYLESNRVPVVSGTGRAGAGNRTPQVTALEPPLLGNPKFTVGVSNALPGANAVLVIDDADPGAGGAIPATGSLARVSVNLSGAGAGGGYSSATLALPTNPSFAGRVFFGRWYVTDAAAANGFAVSPVFRFTIFAPAFTPAVIPTPAPQPTPTPDLSAPQVQFAQPGAVVAEDYASVTLTVNRNGNSAAPASVEYRSVTAPALQGCEVVNGLADQRCDYVLTSGTLNFAAGETAKSFTLIVNEDSYVEGPELVTIELNNPAGAAIGANGNIKIAIADDDTELPANPIDNSQNFVQQQYHDFLARRPDAGGLDFWTGQITGCAPQPSCLESRRIGVSAAFFISQEFQETGYFVYRLYRAAFGTFTSNPTQANVNYLDYMGDRNRVVGGPDLEQQRQAFALAFTQRARFLNEYPLTLTNEQFVNRLFDKAGLTPFTAERQAEIQAMNQGRTRAQVLRNVIDIPAFSNREYNPAFVLAQYFDYLRRDPDAGGYNFWLNVLTQNPQRFQGMVCAFITSREYQERFGSQVTRNNTLCDSITQ
jgi:cytochrome c peroxidase